MCVAILHTKARHSADPLRRTPRLNGRQSQIRRLDGWWEGSSRTLRVVGASGVGKTALVRHWSADIPQTVWCSAEGTRSEAELLEHLTRSLELAADATPRWPAVVASLQARSAELGEVVLVLDGLEGLVDLESEILARFEAMEGLRVIVTSRHSPARVVGVRMDLFGLSLGRDGAAVEMFADVAQRFTDPTSWTQLDWAVVTEIAALLDGVPQAIETEAARVELLSLQALRNRLSQRGPDVSERLLGAIEDSCARLSESDREVLALLACLPGGFSAALAEQLLVARGIQAPLERVTLLLRAALLRLDSPNRDRFSVYRTVRAHIWSTIDASARQACREALLHHVESLAESGFHDESIGALRLEATNIEAALETCLPQTPDQLDTALRLLRVLDEVRARAGQLESHVELLAVWLERAGHRPTDRAILWLELAYARALRELGRPTATASLQRVIDDALLLGDINVAARGLAQLALATAPSNPQLAVRFCITSLPVFEAIEDLQYLGFTHGFLGVSLREQGTLDEAASHLAAAAMTLVDARDSRAEAIANGFAADIALERAYPAAPLSELQRLRRAVDELRAKGELHYAAAHGVLLAIGYTTAGDLSGARAAARAARHASEAASDVPTQSLAMLVEATVAPDAAAHDRWVAEARRLSLTVCGRPARRWIDAWCDSTFSGTDGAMARRLSQLWSFRAVQYPARLRVSEDLSRMILPDGKTISLGRKPLVRRIVTALVERHRVGGEISLEQLIAVCWPGERFSDASSARNRLHVALSSLRKSGFGALMERNRDGYRLISTLVVEMVPTQTSN